MELSIIIVNWKSAGFVRRCLASIFAHPPQAPWEAIVVDNASYDECAAMIAGEFPGIKFIQSAENLGFARANNLGFDRSAGSFLLFLNPDTEIVGSVLESLLEAVRRLPRAGAVGGRLLNSDGSLQTSCVQSFPTILNQMLDSEFLRRRFPRSSLWGTAPLHSAGAEPSEVEAISGACLMMRREVFEDIGQFSTDYFMYAEDIDLCYKARLKGWINYYVPGAAVVHHGSGSSRSARSNFAVVTGVDSLSRYFQKFQGAGYANFYRRALFLSALGRLGALSAGKRLRSAGANGEFDGSLRKWGAILRWSAGPMNRGGSKMPRADPI